MKRSFYLARSGAERAREMPADAVTRTFGIFGVKDTGKTTTGRVLVEGICATGGNVVVLDPVGVWWGATRAGEGPGIPGIVIGGEQGDVPLEQTGGALVGELVIGRHWPLVVIDMKLLRKGEAQRFMADFLETVYFGNRRPLHLVFEEADRALPQSPRGMDPTLGRVLGAAEDIVKLGRSRGLGSTFISQRLATVTKNVTEQVEALILHAQPGPRDRKAVKEWVEVNGDPAKTQKVLETMASMDVGVAWFYSPKWLKVLEQIKVRMPRTFDSSATPTNGDGPVEEARRAPVELAALRQQMAETVERAAANDPRALRERIAELELELERAREEQPEVLVEVPNPEGVASLVEATAALDVAEDGFARALSEALAGFRDAGAEVEKVIGRLSVCADRLNGQVDVASSLAAAGVPVVVESHEAFREVFGDDALPSGVGDEVSDGARKLLVELRGLAPLRLTRTQLATILRRGARSSTLTTQIGELRRVEAIDVDAYGRIAARPSQIANPAPLTRQQVIERWRSALPAGPLAMLDVLLGIEQPIDGITRDALFEEAGFSPTSSTPVTHLKLLKDNNLAEVVNGIVMLGDAI